MTPEECDYEAERDKDFSGEGEKRKWNYFEYLDKVEQELQAGRFASQSK